MTLHYCSYSAATQIDFGALPGFRQFVCLSGAGEIKVGGRGAQLTPEGSALIAPDAKLLASYGDHYSHLVIQLSETEVRRKAELLFGTIVDFESGLPSATMGDSAARFRAIAMALAFQFADEDGASPIVRAELEQALVSAFLVENSAALIRSPASAPRGAGRGDVSRLEEYIQANWDRPLMIEDIAQACGVSVRSVFERFKRQRGVSPLTVLRNVRLDNARRLLLAGDNQQSVIDIAFRCGFSSLGHFAKRYRERFGELPSATLNSRH